MTSQGALPAEVGAGALFGAALTAAGIYSPAIIKAQMRLEDFTMLKTFIAASASGALAMHLADRISFAPIKPRTPQNLGFFAYDGNVVGGALLGAGMALTGACPGTSLVQLAAGVHSGLYVVLGGAAGGILHVAAAPLLRRKKSESPPSSSSSCSPATQPLLDPSASPKKEDPAKTTQPTLQDTLHLSTNALLLAWEALCALAIYLAAVYTPSPTTSPAGLVPPVLGGLLIGAAQAATLLLTKHTIGVSTCYENLARALTTRLPFTSSATAAPLLTPSTAFAAGILGAAALVARLALPRAALAAIQQAGDDVSTPAALLLGGAAMVFGARVAGGCTSGHGISGLATFSWASFASVAAMFASGIAVAGLLG